MHVAWLWVAIFLECIVILEWTKYILDIHQQNAQITNKVQSAPYHSQTLVSDLCILLVNV
jgi:hypothetical protein